MIRGRFFAIKGDGRTIGGRQFTHEIPKDSRISHHHHIHITSLGDLFLPLHPSSIVSHHALLIGHCHTRGLCWRLELSRKVMVETIEMAGHSAESDASTLLSSYSTDSCHV